MSDYRAKLRTIGFARRRGSDRTTPVLDEHGAEVGTQTERWDGRVDATAKRFEVIVNPNVKAERAQDGAA